MLTQLRGMHNVLGRAAHEPRPAIASPHASVQLPAQGRHQCHWLACSRARC